MKKVYVLGASPNNAFVPQFVSLNDYNEKGWTEKAQATAKRFIDGEYQAVVMFNGWHNSGISIIEYILAVCFELPIEWLDLSDKGLEQCKIDIEKVISEGKEILELCTFSEKESIFNIMCSIEEFGQAYDTSLLENIAFHAHNIHVLRTPELEVDEDTNTEK